MKKFHLKIDDSLIIPRFQHKELVGLKAIRNFDSQFFPLLTASTLSPFDDNLPIKLGFELKTIGEQIVASTIHRGYFHHGLEENLSSASPYQSVQAIARLDWRAPLFFQIAMMRAWEELTLWPLDKALYRRYAIALEFSRIAHHLRVIKNILYCLNIESKTPLLIALEETLIQHFHLFERIHSSENMPTIKLSLRYTYDALHEARKIFDQLMINLNLEEQLSLKLAKKASINLALAGLFGLSGPFLRSNRNSYDLRNRNKDLYETSPKVVLTEGGDALARFHLRLLEIDASLAWLKESIALFNSELKEFYPLSLSPSYCLKPLEQRFAMAEIEGLEGVIKVCLFSDDEGRLSFRIRSPGYYIAQALPHLLNDLALGDLFTILHSIGIEAMEVDK